jgi:hypothetical protein
MKVQIEGFEDYSIDENGNVYSKNDKIMIKRIQNSGYEILNLYKDKKHHTFLIHRLLAKSFIPNPNNLKEVDHIDRNKLNNSINNLRWADRSLNTTNVVRLKYKNNSTGEKSVYHRNDKWYCNIQVNKKMYYSPYFKTKEEAIKWRDDFRIE